MENEKLALGLAKYYGEKDGSTILANKKKYAYQLNGLVRAMREAEYIMSRSRIDKVSGMKILDVGCNLGASLKIWSQLGAYACGIEINVKAAQVAIDIWQEEISQNKIKIVIGDASSQTIFNNLPKFDVIILSDVFEHIYNTSCLIKNLASVCNENALLYFNIPNPYYPDYIIEEPHKKLFGLTLLPPDQWSDAGIKCGWSIYHRDFEHYDHLLKYMSFFPKERIDVDVKDFNYPFVKKNDILCKVTNKIMNQLIIKYYDELDYDKRSLSISKFLYKYCTPSWRNIYQYHP